jgi:hypothetical protein
MAAEVGCANIQAGLQARLVFDRLVVPVTIRVISAVTDRFRECYWHTCIGSVASRSFAICWRRAGAHHLVTAAMNRVDSRLLHANAVLFPLVHRCSPLQELGEIRAIILDACLIVCIARVRAGNTGSEQSNDANVAETHRNSAKMCDSSNLFDRFDRLEPPQALEAIKLQCV